MATSAKSLLPGSVRQAVASRWFDALPAPRNLDGVKRLSVQDVRALLSDEPKSLLIVDARRADIEVRQ
jgi:hypothetical protein